MDAPDIVAIVKKLKDRARASPWISAGVPPRERYHHLPNGLNLCLTVDILPKEYMNQLAQAIGTKPPEEVEFWCRTFFEEEPIIEMPGLILAIKAKHFFWRTE